jgi:hypothetical protein
MAEQQSDNPTKEQNDRAVEIDDLPVGDAQQDEVKGGVGIIQKAGGGN